MKALSPKNYVNVNKKRETPAHTNKNNDTNQKPITKDEDDEPCIQF